jgi:hypothetical protein
MMNFLRSAGRVVRVLGLVCVASGPTGCILADAFGECTDDTLNPGQRVNGVDPVSSAAGLLGSHTGTLQWTNVSRTVKFQVVLRSNTAVAQHTDSCKPDSPVVGFGVETDVQATTDDGVLNCFESATIYEDPHGQVSSDQLQLSCIYSKFSGTDVWPPPPSQGQSPIPWLKLHIKPGPSPAFIDAEIVLDSGDAGTINVATAVFDG